MRLRLLLLLSIYAALAVGGLWLGNAMSGGRTTAPSDSDGLAAKLPAPAAFLDENGHPRLDPEALKRFFQEMNLVQQRLDDHQRRLEQRIEQATH